MHIIPFYLTFTRFFLDLKENEFLKAGWDMLRFMFMTLGLRKDFPPQYKYKDWGKMLRKGFLGFLLSHVVLQSYLFMKLLV